MANLNNALQELRAELSRARLHVAKLDKAITVIESLNGSGTSRNINQPKRIISAASRRKMAQAQKTRWARLGKDRSQRATGSVIRKVIRCRHRPAGRSRRHSGRGGRRFGGEEEGSVEPRTREGKMIPPTYKPKKKFMQLAIAEAKRARDRGDYPIGAVITRVIGKREVVIASAGNRVKTSGSSIKHVELETLKYVSSGYGRYLPDFVLYSTHEPCAMCAGACVWSKIGAVVFGVSQEDITAYGKKHGTEEFKWRACLISCKFVLEKGGLHIPVFGKFLRPGVPKVVRISGLLTCYRERDAFHSNGGSSEFATSLRYARACSDVLSLPSSISSTSSEGAIQLFVLTL